MTSDKILKILKDNAYIHTSGTGEELRVAEYLRDCCSELGVQAVLEPFDVKMAKVSHAKLLADGTEIPCKGYFLCGSGSVEAPFYYMPSDDAVSLAGVRGKIVLIDTYIRHFVYQDMLKAGAVGFITYDGNVRMPDNDIDQRELREVVSLGKLIPGVHINAKDAVKLVNAAPETVRIEVEQNEWDGKSHNVVADLPGETNEMLVLTAHYDTTPLSVGSWDNMTGCIALLCIMEALKEQKLHYGVRFVFCGSEERGLLGSKAYVAAHESELDTIKLNINLDMVGTAMGKFFACVSAENALVDFIRYFACLAGWGMKARSGVYSSDSTPFADKGVPALSFARMAPSSQAVIHNRYDTMETISPDQLSRDAAFVADFTRTLACARVFPVSREIPDSVKKELDEYLLRSRKAD